MAEEQGAKWWVRYVLIPVLTSGGIVALVGWLNRPPVADHLPSTDKSSVAPAETTPTEAQAPQKRSPIRPHDSTRVAANNETPSSPPVMVAPTKVPEAEPTKDPEAEKLKALAAQREAITEVVSRWDRAQVTHDRDEVFATIGAPYFLASEFVPTKEAMWERLQANAARGRAAQARGTASGAPLRREIIRLRVLSGLDAKKLYQPNAFRERVFSEVFDTLGLTLESPVAEVTIRVTDPSSGSGYEIAAIFLVRQSGERYVVVGELLDCGKCALTRVAP